MTRPDVHIPCRAGACTLPSERTALRTCLVAFAALLSTASCARTPPPLNVLLVTLDTTRADALSGYGRPESNTPNFDAVARDGTRFDLAISTAAVTPVSHASILTGLFNMEHGLRVLSAASGYSLPPDVPTLATVLEKEGYRTSAFHSAFPVSKYFGLNAGYDVFESIDTTMEAGDRVHRWDVQKFQRRSDDTTNLALAELAKHDEPFFMWIHYWDPHDNARVPPEEFLPQNLPKTDDGTIVPSRQLYDAEVSYVDREFGRVVAALKASGEYERTLIVVVADHGEGLGDHDWGHHRILYQEQIRVPLIVRVPGAQHAASVPRLVRTTDIYPTVLDYLGVTAPRAVSGKSLRGMIEGRSEPDRIAYADQINGYDWNAGLVRTRPRDDFLYCAMDSDWKLIYRPSYPEASELYHIAEDPRELANVFTSEPAQALRLQQELARLNGWVTAPFPKPAKASNATGADEEEQRKAREAMQGLGYTGVEIPSDPTESEWSWICPAHPETQLSERKLCPVCSGRPVLVRKWK